MMGFEEPFWLYSSLWLDEKFAAGGRLMGESESPLGVTVPN